MKRLARRKEMITMRQENGTKTKYPGIYSLSDGTFRIVAKAVDPKTGRARFKERHTREVDPGMTQNAAVAYRAKLIDQIKTDLTASGTPTRIPRLETLTKSGVIMRKISNESMKYICLRNASVVMLSATSLSISSAGCIDPTAPNEAQALPLLRLTPADLAEGLVVQPRGGATRSPRTAWPRPRGLASVWGLTRSRPPAATAT
jgi:hypothetical protein